MNRLLWAVLILGAVGSIGLWRAGLYVEHLEAKSTFEQRAGTVLDNIKARVQRYDTAVQAGQSFITGLGEPVTEARWIAFVQALVQPGRYVGLDGMVFAKPVKEPELETFLSRLSKELGRTVEVSPAGARSVYCPITYAAPATVSRHWVGLDLCALPAAEATLRKAAQSGKTILTERLGKDLANAVLGFYIPVHDRQNNLLGWVGAPVHVSGLMSGLGDVTSHLRVRIFDGSPARGTLLYGHPGPSLPSVHLLSVSRTLLVDGRTWTLEFSAPFVPDVIPLSLGAAGIVCTLLLCGLILNSERTHVKAKHLARLMSAEARESREQLKGIMYSVSEGIYRASPSGVIEFANPAMAHLLGYETAEQLERARVKLAFQDPKVEALQNELLTSERRFREQEAILVRKDGSEFWGLLSQSGVYDAADVLVAVDGAITDITLRKLNEDAIHRLAYFDSLTALPNRKLFEDRLKIAVQTAARHGRRLALMFVDMDRFKTINDTLGHSVGDELLKAVAQRLSSSVRASDTVARLGGDEFVVLLPDYNDVTDLERIASKLVVEASRPYTLLGHDVHSSPSVGVALYPEDGDTEEALLKAADTAMYAAKTAGRNNFQFFRAEMTDASKERLALETGLMKALARDELFVLYAPRGDLLSGEIVGVEAMIGWQRGGEELLSGTELMDLAAHSGQALQVGEWLLASVCNDLRVWGKNGLNAPTVSIAVSAPQLLRGNAVNTVGSVLVAADIPGDKLRFEISEQVINRDRHKVLQTLRNLKKCNVSFALADMGMGGDSVKLLSECDFQELIVSSQYVDDYVFNRASVAMLSAFYKLGSDLHLRVVTKNVTTREQAKTLKAGGATIIQGELLSAPLRKVEFTERLVGLKVPPETPSVSSMK